MLQLNKAAAGAARILVLLVVLAGCGAPVVAQERRVPSAEEIIRRLQLPQISPQDLRSNAVAVEGRRARVQESPSIDLQINFEYASARLTADARIVLDNLGGALTDPALRASRFRIGGHTDARGSDTYNVALSRQRARSVAQYLMSEYQIDAQRLDIEGFGRSQLLDPGNPEGAVNRRVQITNLGP
ncbi:MAG: OmpA family protein [Proteobacteria bacterium]|nr:OmpA family protein [Pseudomonadota bacterium]